MFAMSNAASQISSMVPGTQPHVMSDTSKRNLQARFQRLSSRIEEVDRVATLLRRYKRLNDRMQEIEASLGLAITVRDSTRRTLEGAGSLGMHHAVHTVSSVPTAVVPEPAAAIITSSLKHLLPTSPIDVDAVSSQLPSAGELDSKASTQPPSVAELPEHSEPTLSASATQQRLESDLLRGGISRFRFARVPDDYYDQPLEYRQRCLQAASVDQLTKSIIMENTRAHASVKGISNPKSSQYYVVIVQYNARLNTEKLRSFVHRLSEGQLGKQWFNMRLAPEDVSNQLSGFQHNAISPVGMVAPVPIIISDRITSLPEGCFWMGGGEVDLKLCLRVDDFVRRYKPMIVDCTH